MNGSVCLFEWLGLFGLDGKARLWIRWGKTRKQIAVQRAQQGQAVDDSQPEPLQRRLLQLSTDPYERRRQLKAREQQMARQQREEIQAAKARQLQLANSRVVRPSTASVQPVSDAEAAGTTKLPPIDSARSVSSAGRLARPTTPQTPSLPSLVPPPSNSAAEQARVLDNLASNDGPVKTMFPRRMLTAPTTRNVEDRGIAAVKAKLGATRVAGPFTPTQSFTYGAVDAIESTLSLRHAALEQQAGREYIPRKQRHGKRHHRDEDEGEFDSREGSLASAATRQSDADVEDDDGESEAEREELEQLYQTRLQTLYDEEYDEYQVFDLAENSSATDYVVALDLTDLQIVELQTAYANMKPPGAPGVGMMHIEAAVDWNTSLGPLRREMLLLVRQPERVLLKFRLWLEWTARFCLMSKDDLIRLVYRGFDSARNGTMTRKDLNTLIAVLHSNTSKPKRGHMASVCAQILRLKSNSLAEGFKFKEFSLLHKKFPSLLFPVFEIQAAYTRAVLGEKFWEEKRAAIAAMHEKPVGNGLNAVQVGGPSPEELLELP